MKFTAFLKKFWVIILIILLGLGGFFFWKTKQGQSQSGNFQTVAASRGNLTANVGATGTVRAKQSASLTWQTSGRVEAVYAEIGGRVKSGDVLAKLVQTSMPQNVILAEADLISAQKSLDDLKASNTQLAQAELDLAKARQAVDDAQDKVDGLSFARASDNLIQQTQANIDLARRDLQRAEENYKKYAHKPDGDSGKAEALLKVTTARQKLTDLSNNYNWYTATATPLDAEKYRADLSLAQAQLADAEREVERLNNGPDANDIVAAKARIAAAQSTLNQSMVIAPFNGIITQADPTPGDMVNPGTLAYRIDDISHMLVDLQISEVDINNITIGQPVTVTFDAVQGKTYEGRVSEISQAGESTGSGVNFTVTVELVQADDLVKPGMTAAVSITVREIKDALLVQNRAVRQLEGKRVVYVLKNGQPEAVEIRLGATADITSEVAGGDLKEGDLIILNPPAANPFGQQ